jgi:hypothetical protein
MLRSLPMPRRYIGRIRGPKDANAINDGM